MTYFFFGTLMDRDVLASVLDRPVARDELSRAWLHGYRRLRETFERLSGTRIVTNIETGGTETTTGFGLIESWEIQRKTRRRHRIKEPSALVMLDPRASMRLWRTRARMTGLACDGAGLTIGT